MSNTAKFLLIVVVLLGIGGGLVMWKSRVLGKEAAEQSSVTKSDMETLLKDANPMVLKRLADDPELKTKQLENIKQLMSLASQARREGLDKDPEVTAELDNIRDEITATNYDKDLNKDKGQMPPFGFISEDQVNSFWGDPNAGGISAIWSDAKRHETEFNQFLDTKVNLMKKKSPQMKDREITDDERKQARDFFAKIKIYDEEYAQKLKAGQISQELQDKTKLQVKLQQASFLASLYAEKLADQTKVTDEDVDKYIGEHPELSPQEKKNKALDILNQAKNGADFAKLAKENSDDPGSKDNGGLYEKVTKGKMMPEFEAAALAQQPGQIAPDLVETSFGYHIIKLEKKSEGKDPQGQPTETYDVRHILISTGVKDPENPAGREMPVKDFVRSKLEQDKQKEVLDKIVADNHVEVATDFDIPPVSDEQLKQVQQQMQMQQMQQQMQGMPPGGMPAGPGGKGSPKVPVAPKTAPAKGK